MMFLSLFTFVVLSAFFCGAQGVICLFYHLKADCQYRLDGFAMSRIQATINECHDPVDISFKITNDNPKIEWTHTFENTFDNAEVPGYFQKIFLQVKQHYVTQTKQYNVQVNVMSEHLRTVTLMNSTMTLHGQNCSILNESSKIAIAVLGSLLGLAVIGLIIVCVIKRRRDISYNNQPDPSLVENAELPDSSHPVASPSMLNESANQNRSSDFQDMVTYSHLARNHHQRF